VGDVTMNITQDAQKAVDAVQAYVDAYNEVMTWINEKLDEKYTSATIEEDDDYLQNLLSASKGSTVFGALHGDQLLWNIKNQMRNLTVNPIDSAARGLATKKYMYTANSLGLNASFYLYTAGQAIRVNISPTDSLEDIRHNIANSTSITSTNGTSATDADLKLKVYLRDGQLVVDYNSASVLTSPRTDVIARNHASLDGGGYNYDILPYTVTTAPPVSGKLSVTLGSTEYKEGIDYKIETAEVSGRLESRLVWLATGSRPTDGQSYTTSYEYNTTAIAYSVISGADDLSTLGFHTDQSKSQLSTFGITTTADDYGKSGLVDFDPDVLFAAIQDDANNASNVMTSFFRSVDTYIGNLVDSSQVLVAGTAVTKGRIAGAMLSIDVEVETLNSQITKLERQLAERQTSMYKQYSDMELAIQKLNAQMSSMSQYFANTSGS
jgi:flagellar hook-associated protein 2